MKLTGLILTYNCENLVQKAINKIPKNILYEVICIDDESKDNTRKVIEKNNISFFTHKHTGYGGNLFEGLKIAFKRGATHVVEIHGDGQYDLSKITDVYKILKASQSFREAFYLAVLGCLKPALCSKSVLCGMSFL